MTWGTFDGISWLLEKRALLMHHYGWSEERCRTGISSRRGWAYYNAAKEMQWSAMGGPMWQMKGDGYIAQQRKVILRQWATKSQ